MGSGQWDKIKKINLLFTQGATFNIVVHHYYKIGSIGFERVSKSCGGLQKEEPQSKG